jgi:hypothetical protein
LPGQKPVSAKAKPLGSELLISTWVFLAQGGPRQQQKCPEPPKISFLNMFFFKLYDACSQNGNVKYLATSSLEKDESIFHLAAISQRWG